MEDNKKSLEELAAGSGVSTMAEAMGDKAAEEAKEVKKAEEPGKVEVPEEPIPSMDDFKDLLEASYRRFSVGDVLTGTVIDVDETGVTLDFNYYAPGKIAADQMSNDPNFSILTDVKVGDSITATVTRLDDGAGNLVLSRKEADDLLAWERLEKMKAEKTVITGKITEVVPKGAIMYVEGVRGFIPASRLDLEFVEDTTPFLNQEIQVLVHEVDEDDKKLILSARELLTEKQIEIRNEKSRHIEVGTVVEGTVESLQNYGAFVNIGDGLSGLVHISEICEKRIKHPKVVLSVGETVKVKIIKVQDGKISLSMKAVNDILSAEPEEDDFHFESEGEATTSLASLFKNIKLN